MNCLGWKNQKLTEVSIVNLLSAAKDCAYHNQLNKMNMEKVKVGDRFVEKMFLDKWEYLTDIKITKECKGKMKHLLALNTSMYSNPLCKLLSENKSFICSKCYSKQFLGYRKSARKVFEGNFDVLTKSELEYVPDIDSAMFIYAKKLFRFEMFGDICNEIQAFNYLAIATANPETIFGWWTKHPNIIEKAINKYEIEIPKNLSIVASSKKFNEIDKIYKLYPFVDHLFTVYSYDFCKNNNVEINCGSNSCYKCMRCYKKDSDDFYISEMLKSDKKKH